MVLIEKKYNNNSKKMNIHYGWRIEAEDPLIERMQEWDAVRRGGRALVGYWLESIHYDEYDMNIKGAHWSLVSELRQMNARGRWGLARPEFMEPVQTTLETRWKQEQKYIVPQPAAIEASRTAGYGYHMAKRAIGKEIAPVSREDTSQAKRISQEQFHLLRRAYYYLPDSVADLHTVYDVRPDEYSRAVATIDAADDSVRTYRLLEWLDERSFEKAQKDMPIDGQDDVLSQSLGYLNMIREPLQKDPINRGFGLQLARTTPLAILGLVRMKNRGVFMDEYENEFNRLIEKQTRLSEIGNEMNRLSAAATSIGKSEYFTMQLKTTSDSFHALKKELILDDVRLAALAYSYDHNPEKARQTYSPIETEGALLNQLGVWQREIDNLCNIPIDHYAEPMQMLIVQVMSDCLDIKPSARYGEALRETVQFIYKIGPMIQSQGDAIEAHRKIKSMLLG